MPSVDLSVDKINLLIAEVQSGINRLERTQREMIGTVDVRNQDIARVASRIQLGQGVLRKLQRSADNADTGIRAGREGNARRRKTRKNRRT